MNRRLAAFTVLAALALGFLLVRTDTAEAQNEYVGLLTTAYPGTAGTKLADCTTCHTSGLGFNSFGTDLKAAGLNFSAVAGMDSDGDGFTNDEELKALTFPGSSSDKPATTTTQATTPPTTSPTTPGTSPSTSTTVTTVATTTSIPAPVTVSSLPVATVAESPAFPMEIDLGEAGMVTIKLVNGKLVAEVLPGSSGWTFEIETEDDEVEVKLRNGETEIEVEAEYEDGRVKVKIESEDDDDDD